MSSISIFMKPVIMTFIYEFRDIIKRWRVELLFLILQNVLKLLKECNYKKLIEEVFFQKSLYDVVGNQLIYKLIMKVSFNM